MTDDEKDDVYSRFREAVNMPPKAIEDWLETDDSKRVGWKGDDGKGSGESVGHKSGKRIVELRHKKKADLTDDDYDHMKTVAAYVARHCKQGPADDKEHSDWRYSLMNWGHDPCKD